MSTEHNDKCVKDTSREYPFADGNMIVKSVCATHGTLLNCGCGNFFAFQADVENSVWIEGMDRAMCPNCKCIWFPTGEDEFVNRIEPVSFIVFADYNREEYVSAHKNCEDGEGEQIVAVGLATSKVEAVVKAVVDLDKQMPFSSFRVQFVSKSAFEIAKEELHKKNRRILVDSMQNSVLGKLFTEIMKDDD